MGDLHLSCEAGNIHVDKVKGTNIEIQNGHGSIVVRKVLEGGVNIHCNDLNAKMINGDTVNIVSTENVHVGAMYGKESKIFSGGKVDVGLFKGNIHVSYELNHYS